MYVLLLYTSNSPVPYIEAFSQRYEAKFKVPIPTLTVFDFGEFEYWFSESLAICRVVSGIFPNNAAECDGAANSTNAVISDNLKMFFILLPKLCLL